MKKLISVFSLISLSSCGLLFPENGRLLTVTPVKFIPCDIEKHNTCGRVPTSQENADGFIVEVGYEKFKEIVGKNLNITLKESVDLFSQFAVREVISYSYCTKAEVPQGHRYILSWEGRGERAIYVTCQK